MHQADTDPAFKQRVRASADTQAGSVGGDEFRLPLPGAGDFTVTVEVLAPDRSTVVELITQGFTITAAGALVAAFAATNGAVLWTHRLHPRLTGGLAPDAGGVVRLRLDLTFVDMTSVVASQPGSFEEYNRPHLADPRNPGRDDPHHGCLCYAFELTRAPTPKTWFMLVPPKVSTQPANPFNPAPKHAAVPDIDALTARKFDVLTFFRPSTGTTYSRVEQTPVSGRIGRYFVDPPVFAPFFATPNPPFWHSFPAIGLQEQLARSGKRVLSVFPWPSQGNYGPAGTSQLPKLLESLVLAAYSRGIIGTANQLGVSVGRLGIAGFSLGGGTAIRAWLDPTVRGRCSELYLFDANDIDTLVRDPRTVRDWLDRDHTRVIRMTGALHLRQALALATAVDAGWPDKLAKADQDPAKNPPPRVWCRPGEVAFFTGRTPGSIYGWAFQVPPDPAHPRDRSTYPATPPGLAVTPASSPLTSRSGIVFTDAGTASTVTVALADTPAKTVPMNGVSAVEVSGFAAFSLRDSQGAVHTIGELRKFADAASRLLVLPTNVRHQWAICGGQGDPSRGDGFEGYFFLCLRDSGFAT